ncbi:helix-turn-helix transcriptional regulator [Brevibacillus brevis]|uniref:helix-turn-helix domain-containing protein n=1 Tax=Brevibacillus sp. MER 51 TaxID=2939560 RepID=UPI0020412167|nr:helix-turn-helix transcriptional regulator [Brevibacillus sp. MER 51]MCM3141336.1 helix-turn-helix domain-containing protein [Brevibacillus sp. MER 51]WGV57824.1 helix-turn-helix transcriptional regulator [Brevibacillus brevis]
MYGQRIKEARLAMGMSRKDLAEKLGVNETTITRYENEKRKPDPETLTSLSEILKVTTDYLLGIDESEKAQEEDENLQELIDFYGTLSAQEREDFVKHMMFIKNGIKAARSK